MDKDRDTDRNLLVPIAPKIVTDAGTPEIIKPFNLNNKDLLLVSLLEYICNIHDKSNDIFYIICEYLKDNGVIEKDDVYSLDSSHLREIYMKMINTLVASNKDLVYEREEPVDNKGQIIKYESPNFYSSRYKSDFIEFEHLGKGGFGSVFKAYNKLDQNLYAIKKIPIQKLDEEKSNFYLNEVRHLSSLNHPNIVRYYTTWIDFSEYLEEGSKDLKIVPTLHIQMELCSVSLAEYLEERNYRGFKFDKDDEEDSKDIFKQIIAAVKHIHSNDIIHRDLSLRNIFLDDELNVKIGDFGLSKRSADDCLYDAADSYGNLVYMAPEEIEDYRCSKKSDIYSLGIIYFELLTPFKTMMERMVMIQSLKDKEWEKFTHLSKRDLNLIKWMTEDDYEKRPTIDEVNETFS